MDQMMALATSRAAGFVLLAASAAVVSLALLVYLVAPRLIASHTLRLQALRRRSIGRKAVATEAQNALMAEQSDLQRLASELGALNRR